VNSSADRISCHSERSRGISGCFWAQLVIETILHIRNFIDGEFVEPISGRYLDNVEPAN
jgi:hypothetical protein